MDARLLDMLGQIAKGIAAQFGPNCEVVVHEISDKSAYSSIVAIENGHVSGRKVGDGPSHVVLEQIGHDDDQVSDQLCYLTRTKDGKTLKSSSVYIHDEHGKVAAILGINYDISMMQMFENTLHEFNSVDAQTRKEPERITLNVADLLEDLIRQADELVGKPVALMTKDDKVKAIRYLSKSGALMITKSGDKIAKHFGISKYTLYSYLDNSKTGGETYMNKTIDLTINREGLAHNIQKAKENNIIIPTIAQMQNPDLIPEKIKEKLSHTGLWDVDPVNLFRINWHNEAKESGGLYQKTPNYVEIPSSVSGVPCRILAMSGKWFPTGCHKVGASFGCLAPRLVTGQFDATYHHAVWPSTGNYCRGGAFNSKLLACDSVAILPQDMSKERFDWLKTIAGQIIATPGCESNVKEIFDKTWELKQDPSMMIFNQFAEMGNPLWHYNVTGYALSDLFENTKKPGQRLAGACFTSGSAGTMSAGDLLKERYPGMKLAVGEALQCPTILDNGFGGHRIEGIGDKHIPWVHNVKNTDMVIDIDDEDSQRLLRLFNCKEGQEYLKTLGLSDEQIEKFTWMGISGIANVLCCIKFAKYYELTEDDVVVTVLTDSAVMYKSRVEELNEMYGAYSAQAAELDHNLHMLNLKTDSMLELTYTERKRVHNLKYYTWVEQQGMDVEDLNAQWYDTKGTWDAVHAQAKELDELINAFNDEVGLLKTL